MPVIKLYRMRETISARYCVTLLVFFLITLTSHAQDTDSAALAAADTTNFSRNAGDSWQLYNSYVAQQGTDSVIVQLILQHDNNINWNDEQYVGIIKGDSFLPFAERPMPFALAGTNYQFRIVATGECYLKAVSGDPPVNDPVVLPFTVVYNK